MFLPFFHHTHPQRAPARTKKTRNVDTHTYKTVLWRPWTMCILNLRTYFFDRSPNFGWILFPCQEARWWNSTCVVGGHTPLVTPLHILCGSIWDRLWNIYFLIFSRKHNTARGAAVSWCTDNRTTRMHSSLRRGLISLRRDRKMLHGDSGNPRTNDL